MSLWLIPLNEHSEIALDFDTLPYAAARLEIPRTAALRCEKRLHAGNSAEAQRCFSSPIVRKSRMRFTCFWLIGARPPDLAIANSHPAFRRMTSDGFGNR